MGGSEGSVTPLTVVASGVLLGGGKRRATVILDRGLRRHHQCWRRRCHRRQRSDSFLLRGFVQRHLSGHPGAVQRQPRLQLQAAFERAVGDRRQRRAAAVRAQRRRRRPAAHHRLGARGAGRGAYGEDRLPRRACLALLPRTRRTLLERYRHRVGRSCSVGFGQRRSAPRGRTASAGDCVCRALRQPGGRIGAHGPCRSERSRSKPRASSPTARV